MAFKRYKKNRLELHNLEKTDGKYNVGALVKIDFPWVDKGMAEEILEIVNAEYDAMWEVANEMIDKRTETI